LGNRLCRLVEKTSTPNPEQLTRISALVAGIGVIIRQRLSGDGGAQGLELLGL
jgi:hypothetical protein